MSRLFVSPGDVPPNRREAHRRALDLLDQHELDGRPFVLQLRTYLMTQLFLEAPDGYSGSELFENVLYDQLAPLGIGVITVQPQGIATEAHFPPNDERGHGVLEVRSPALFVRTKRWMVTVEYLISRAGFIVVLLQAGTPGVLRELEALVAMGRADQTVIVLFQSSFTDPLPDYPILDRFLRVVLGHELDQLRLAEDFLLTDLVHAMPADRAVAPVATDWRAVAAGYERLARNERGRRAMRDAAGSYGRAVRVSLRAGDLLGAVRQAEARATILEQLGATVDAREVLGKLSEVVPHSAVGERGLARAKLDAAMARRMADQGEVTEALELLDESRRRAAARDDPRSGSVLQTTSAWIRRSQLDPLAAIAAGIDAVALAERAGTDSELWRALIVVGIVWGDLGEWRPHGLDALARAVATMPDEGAEEDLWLVLMTLGRLASQASDATTALVARTAAAHAAVIANLPAEARTAREALLAAMAQ